MKKAWLIGCVVAGILHWQCRRSDPVETHVDQRPNIIFLLADDMRYDALGCTGNSLAATPNLDTLAAQGTNFRNAYVTSAICAISRASIFTGQYAKRHGITDFAKNLSTNALLQTYPFLLRQHGYYTGFIGKYGVGTDLPSRFFDFWRGYPGHGVYFIKDSAGNLVHETAMMGRQAKEFLDQRNKTRPFCLSISFKAPHSEDGVTENNGFRCDPFFNSWYVNVHFPFPETYDDSYYQRFSPAWRMSPGRIENEARVRWKMRFAPEKFQTSTHAIYRLVSGVDKAVGELRSYLREQHLDSNTILVFTSDNGYYMGEHGLEGKWFGHEESVRVPLIIYDPRVPQQRKIVEQIALNVDLAPTILTWAELDVPARMQGRPLQSLLTGGAADWRNEFFYEHPYDPGTEAYIPKSVGLVTPSWKYLQYYNGRHSGQGVVYEELFDVASDPHEKHNRINEPAQQIRLEAYRKKTTQCERQLR